MKRILMITLMFVCPLILWAQNISVSSFRLLENVLDANTKGTIEKDQNGEVAALIKVVTTQTGFTFDGGALGIVKTVQKPGEIWVYVPRGLKKITISHSQLGILRDYYLPMPVASARTYKMVLVTKDKTWQDQTSIYGEAEINSSPSMADIYIDGKRVGQTPQTVTKLSIGEHQIRISKRGYKDYISIMKIKDNEKNILSTIMEMPDSGQTQKVSSTGVVSSGGNMVITIDNVSFTMVLVEGGTFQMGATKEQGQEVEAIEKPVHQVSLSPYYIGETEVTQELWEAVMGINPSNGKGKKRPVNMVSWNDCQEFIRYLNAKTGRKFRLPTEAEWEFAARGGNRSQNFKYSGSNTLDDVAWYKENHAKGPEYTSHTVKTKQANELGLFDMSGNVLEWCQDWYGIYSDGSQSNPTGPSSGSKRIVRGGAYNLDRECRISYRDAASLDDRWVILGLRLAL